jgi:mRNA interferase MazF
MAKALTADDILPIVACLTPQERLRLLRGGEIRWYTFRAPDKRRPVLILTRNEVIDRLNETIVAPVTRTIRGLTTEVALSAVDGMPVACG